MNNDPEYLKALAQLEATMPTGDPESLRAVEAVRALEVRAMNDQLVRYVPGAIVSTHRLPGPIDWVKATGARCESCNQVVSHTLVHCAACSAYVCMMCYTHGHHP